MSLDPGGNVGEGIDLSSMAASGNGESGQPIDLPEGAFNGKSLPACVKLYLSATKRKKTLREIAIALRDGGVESTSDNFENVVNGALFRLKTAGEVLRFKDGWGLPEWYPANIRASAPVGPSAKRAKKKTKRSVRNKVEPKPSVTPNSGNASERALEFLGRNSESEYSLAEIAANLGMGSLGTRLLLGKLKKVGKVRMTAPNMYAIGRPLLVSAGD
jgi:hypothetical protein